MEAGFSTRVANAYDLGKFHLSEVWLYFVLLINRVLLNIEIVYIKQCSA